MKFQLQTLVVGLAIAAGATTADAQMSSSQNGAARGPNTSFYYGRNVTSSARSDPVNTPSSINTNPMVRPTARFGPVTTSPVTPVPEPSEWAMMLAGLALVGFIVRRNSKRS